MMTINRKGLLSIALKQPNKDPYMIILHDTAGPSLVSAEHTLVARKLGYHYMVDRDGTCYEYALPSTRMNHALGFNAGTIGVSMVGGGGYGPVTTTQCEAVVDLINTHIKPLVGASLTKITGHKYASTEGKVDPEFSHENGNSLSSDDSMMRKIANQVTLEFVKPTGDPR